MKRRDFMRMTATASGMLLCGGARLALAQQAFSGPYWLFIDARGGWDPTSFCDPKGFGLGANGDINNYDPSDIRQIGRIRYAPPPMPSSTIRACLVTGSFSKRTISAWSLSMASTTARTRTRLAVLQAGPDRSLRTIRA